MKKRDALNLALRGALEEWSRTPFVWGVSDCLLSLADIIVSARGYDPAAPFRGRYTTRLGAFRVTREFGGIDGALEAMAFDSGWREIAPRLAKVGDIGILVNAGGAVGGVIKDEVFWLGRKDFGYAASPTKHVDRAWRVR